MIEFDKVSSHIPGFPTGLCCYFSEADSTTALVLYRSLLSGEKKSGSLLLGRTC